MKELNIALRSREIQQVDKPLRKARDVLVIAPPASGLTTFLKGVGSHVEMAEHFSQFRVLHIDCGELVEGLTIESFCQLLLQKLNLDQNIAKTNPTKDERLAEFLEGVLNNYENQRFVITLDNLHALPIEHIKLLLQQVRVVSESRRSKQVLRYVMFVIGAHSLDLRQYDPEHDSPFNVAEKIHLEDLAEIEALEFIENSLSNSRYVTGFLVARYISYVTGNHPYLINEICSHVLDEIVSSTLSNHKLDFRIIDQVVEIMCENGEDHLLRQLSHTIAGLADFTLDHLRDVLNGSFYDARKKSPPLRELALLGIISDSKGPVWQIRNPIFDLYLRRNPRLRPVLGSESFVPSRLFANQEGYRILFKLENQLRHFVLAKMYAKYGSDWWQRVDANVAGYCQGLQTKELESGWFPSENLSLLAYAQLPHLRKIINDNWAAIFHNYFKPQTIFTGVFEALEGIRNRIAHNRPLTDYEVEQLAQYAGLFQNCMYDALPSALDSIRNKSNRK